MQNIDGPFGKAHKIDEMPVSTLEQMYADKCGAVLDLRERGIESLDLYECDSTGFLFWRPEEAAGDEEFYQDLSKKWPDYYRDWRWEYSAALSLTSATDRLLEIGCGRGYFLRSTEGRVASARGIEFNNEAIANKVTKWGVEPMKIEAMAASQPQSFDYICSFQVLEHVTDPASFIEGSLACLKPGGLLVYSTPNTQFGAHRRREDAFDLPPHHMNYFSHDSYRRIAARYGLQVVKMVDAPTWGAMRNATLGRPLFLSISKMKDALRSARDRMNGETGITTLVAMRKPA